MDTLSINDTGVLVELVQSVLQELGFYSGPIDSIFGSKTRKCC